MAKKKSRHRKKSRKSPGNFARLSRWHYYKDDKIPYGDWTVTVTDVNRWREMMRSRFPDYQFVIKFRCQIDEDGKPIEGTREMAFWFENIPKMPQISDGVAEEEEGFEEAPEDQYAPDFISFWNPREYWINQEESLPWYSVEAFIEQGVDSENPLRDRTTQWTQIDELGEVSNYYEMSPLLEFLQAVPNQEASYAQSKK